MEAKGSVEITKNGLCAYKKKPAIITAIGDKITINTGEGGELRVREKDIEPLHEGPAEGPAFLAALGALGIGGADADANDGPLREAWELCLADGGTEASLSIKELSELAFGAFTPKSAWDVYSALMDGIYFVGTPSALHPRPAAEVEAEAAKRSVKRLENGRKAAFLARLKEGGVDPLADAQYLMDVEALALGKTDVSRTLREAGLEETAVSAHRVLVETGYWPPYFDPHPSRFGIALKSASAPVPPPPDEARVDLSALPAFAIDNEWSDDPDDAVYFEPAAEGGDPSAGTLYVHVADPAASVLPGTEADAEAQSRAVTFYGPEGISRMITAEAFPFYALGLADTSPALTFKLRLGARCAVEGVEIFPSIVRVTRLCYREADGDPRIAPLFPLAERSIEKRLDLGAALIEFPEVRVIVRDGKPEVIPQRDYRSAAAVRECMLLAGEAAGRWASARQIAFPYVSQETGELPDVIHEGFAGSYKLRRCMRPRSLSVRPALHWGLGLDIYAQVTSPLRRYTDLLAHQQIRAFLRREGGASGGMKAEPPMDADTLILRLGAAEKASQAAARAERASLLHWKLVFLSDKIDSEWDAILLERNGPRAVFLLPALGMETVCSVPKGTPDIRLNGAARLVLKSVRVPEASASFILR
jgi:exoribonuclease-2